MPEPATNYPGAEHVPLDYPGKRPNYSYIYRDELIYPIRHDKELTVVNNGEFLPLDQYLSNVNSSLLNQRFAVLAVGSNACPGRLVEKFGNKRNACIPVIRVDCMDLAAVYAAFLSAYGAIPATVSRLKGYTTELWATLLDQKQFETMNLSESLGEHYQLVRIPSKIAIQMDGDNCSLNPVYAYFYRNVLQFDKSHVHLSMFPVSPKPLRHLMNQREVLCRALDELGILMGRPIEKRNQLLRTQPELRKEVSSELSKKCSIKVTGLDKWIVEPNNVQTIEKQSDV